MNKRNNFYEFHQNNSGGTFVTDGKLCHIIYIEAETASEAIDKALSFGVYFDGVEKGMDCECCGDRWSEPREHEVFPKTEEGECYEDIVPYVQDYANRTGFHWTDPFARIFYKDGRVIEIREEKR